MRCSWALRSTWCPSTCLACFTLTASRERVWTCFTLLWVACGGMEGNAIEKNLKARNFSSCFLWLHCIIFYWANSEIGLSAAVDFSLYNYLILRMVALERSIWCLILKPWSHQRLAQQRSSTHLHWITRTCRACCWTTEWHFVHCCP